MHYLRLALPTIVTILVATTVGKSAWAHSIVVLRPHGSDPTLTESFSRLCGELHMYGLNVVVLDREDGDSFSSNRLAEGEGVADVVGGVSLLRTPGQASANIWITDTATAKDSVRITVSVDDVDAPSRLAIRVVDLLRASLRDFSPAGIREPQSGIASSLASSTRVATRESGPDRWAIRGGAISLWETGDLGLGFAAMVGFARRVSPRLALELSLVAPVIGQSYQSAKATARVRQQLGIVAASWRVVGRRLVSLDLFQGLGAMYLAVRGDSHFPWLGQSASAWAAASSTGACIGFSLTEHVAVGISVAAVLILPRPVLEVADVAYAVRQPLVLATGEFRYAF